MRFSNKSAIYNGTKLPYLFDNLVRYNGITNTLSFLILLLAI